MQSLNMCRRSCGLWFFALVEGNFQLQISPKCGNALEISSSFQKLNYRKDAGMWRKVCRLKLWCFSAESQKSSIWKADNILNASHTKCTSWKFQSWRPAWEPDGQKKIKQTVKSIEFQIDVTVNLAFFPLFAAIEENLWWLYDNCWARYVLGTAFCFLFVFTLANLFLH